MTGRDTYTWSNDVRSHLERLLNSPNFDASHRNRRFLRYIVEETLEGRADRIKGYSIATQVFGRDASFDPQTDPIVRIEARRLRASLERYYLLEGARHEQKIVIRKGSYVPEFQRNRAVPGNGRPAQDVADPTRSPSCPRILVLPFRQEGAQGSFSCGFTRQVILNLVRFSSLYVYGPETAFDWGAAPAPARLAEDLAVDFVVSGDVALSDDWLCVEAFLTDARNGRCLWGQAYERSLDHPSLFKIRDELADRVARCVGQPYGVIYSVQARESDSKAPDQLSAFEWVVRFHQYARACNLKDFERLRRGLEDAVAREPQYADAFACLSQVYAGACRFGLHLENTGPSPLRKALSLAERAVEMAPYASSGYVALAAALWLLGDTSGTIRALEIGRSLNPNDTTVMAELGLRHAFRGDWDRAVPLLEASYERNPAQPSFYRIGLSLCHYMNARYQEALCEAVKVDTPAVVHGYVLEAIALARLGRAAEAAAPLSEIRRIDPLYGQHVIRDWQMWNVYPDIVRQIRDGLRQANFEVADLSSAETSGNEF